MELDDDGKYAHTGKDWKYGIPPEPEYLVHVLSAFIYEYCELDGYEDPENFYRWVNKHTDEWYL